MYEMKKPEVKYLSERKVMEKWKSRGLYKNWTCKWDVMMSTRSGEWEIIGVQKMKNGTREMEGNGITRRLKKNMKIGR